MVEKKFGKVLVGLFVSWSIWTLALSIECGAAEPITMEVRLEHSVGNTSKLRPLLDGVGYDHDPDDPIAGKLKDIGIKRIRLINVDNQTKVVDGKLIAPLLDTRLDWCQRYSFIPHIIIGQFIPRWLSTHQGDIRSGPKDFQAYDDYVRLFFNHVIFQKGFADTTWEVANEPDCGDAPVPQFPRPKIGSEEAYQAYLQLYRHIANVAQQIEKEHPGLKITLGGPASCGPGGGTYKQLSFNWHERFLKDVAQQGLKLDFFSLHYYGNQGELGRRQNLTENPTFEAVLGKLHQWIKTYKPDTPLWITEWGFSWLFNKNPEAASLNASNVGASWSAAFITSMLRHDVNRSFLLCSNDKDGNWSWPALFHGTRPKPLYFVFAMFKAMNGNLVEVAGETKDVGILAATDNRKITALLWNYNWARGRVDKGREGAQNHEVILQIKELPSGQTEYQVKTSLLAEVHGNPLTASRSQATDGPLVINLGKFRQNQGALKVNLALPPSGVMLVEINPESR
jgi:xylan 1,4-beta-xylosidase